jgi:CO/xanthine dehydrogenase FAD-binding subunit
VRSAATVGGNLFARNPMAISVSRCSRWTPWFALKVPEGLDELDLETFFKSRSQLACGSIVTAVCSRRPMPEDFRFDQFVAALRV